MTFEEFKQGWKGQKLAPLFIDPAVVDSMERTTRLGAPAVKAIDGDVADAVGSLDDVERQHVGRWVRDTLARRGWRTLIQRSWRGGRVFTSGTVYVPIAPDPRPVGADSLSDSLRSDDRVVDARRVLMAGRLDRDRPPGSVDDFLADRRASWGGE